MTTMPYQRTVCAQSWTAAVVLLILRIAGLAARPFGYKGVGRLAKTLGKILPPAPCLVKFSKETVLAIDLYDAYWTRLIFADFVYEPEVDTFLKENLDAGAVFLDCGANIGYWSVLISERMPKQHVVAVEPSPETHAKLQANNHLSGDRFYAVQRAISDRVGETVPFVISEGHAAAHIAQGISAADTITVPVLTTTVDEILRTAPLDPAAKKIVIKLDVEGAEIAAVRGANKTIAERDVVFIFECHGKDLDCVTTRMFLDDNRYEVFSLDRGMTRIRSVEDAATLKTDPRKGYNFVALKRSQVTDNTFPTSEPDVLMCEGS